MSVETLQQAYQLIKQGKNGEAIQLLKPILKSDRDNKNAWWLLANAATKPEQIEFALQNVLRIDPYHSQAQAKLDALQAQSAADFFGTIEELQPFASGTSSYFDTSIFDDAPQEPGWSSIESQEIRAFTPKPSLNPRTTTSMPLYPQLQPKTTPKSTSNANFWFAAGAMVLAGICAMLFIMYSAGVFDSILGELPPAPPPQAGWSTYEGNGMSLQLPSHWVEFDLTASTTDMLYDTMVEAFPEFATQVQAARDDPDLYRFMALNNGQSTPTFVTNVVVTTETIGYFMSLDSYMDVALEQLPSEFNILSQTTRETEPFGEIGLIETNPQILGINSRQVIYVIKRSNRIWVITFSTDATLIETLRSDFEHSLTTFRPD